jgi:hypothetical protein
MMIGWDILADIIKNSLPLGGGCIVCRNGKEDVWEIGFLESARVGPD